MLDVAARKVDEESFAGWLRQRVRFAEYLAGCPCLKVSPRAED